MRAMFVLPLLFLSACVGSPSGVSSEWIEECVRRLDSENAEVAAGAERAIGVYGHDAMSDLVRSSRMLETEVGWKRLGKVFAEMGPGTKTRLAALRSRWPARTEDRLEAILARLDDSDDLERKIRTELEYFSNASRYSPSDPRVLRIAAMGRSAVPVLIRLLGEPACNRPGSCFYGDAVADALVGLVEERDIPALEALLGDGVLVAARSLKRVRGEAALAALLVPVKKDMLDHDVLVALKAYRRRPAVKTHLVDYLRRVGKRGDWVVGQVAEFLAEAAAYEAIPVLRTLLEQVPEQKAYFGAALAALGAKDGFPVLIDVLEAAHGIGAGRGAWERHLAGETLNRLSGHRHYEGGFGGGTHGTSELRGNFAKAVTAYRAWWSANEARLVFDKESRSWRLGE